VDGYYTGKRCTGSSFVPITPVRLTEHSCATKQGRRSRRTPRRSQPLHNLSGIPTTVSAVAGQHHGRLERVPAISLSTGVRPTVAGCL